ncbi:hypothetical protein [Psychrobacillus sp. FSL H8-0510]|uniref:hypothetical protein n=1 Tax=Psychrobacillus sp. FSL H8-0510 TaxID=2921394 RepID=UPI0030F909DD
MESEKRTVGTPLWFFFYAQKVDATRFCRLSSLRKKREEKPGKTLESHPFPLKPYPYYVPTSLRFKLV